MKRTISVGGGSVAVKFEYSRKTIGAHTVEFSVKVLWMIGLDEETGDVSWRPTLFPMLGPGLEGEPEEKTMFDISDLFRKVEHALSLGPEHYQILYKGELRKKGKKGKKVTR